MNKDPKQYHFIIMFNEETGAWDLDIDTLIAKFDGYYVFDNNTQDWETLTDETYDAYVQLEAQVADMLDKANGN